MATAPGDCEPWHAASLHPPGEVDWVCTAPGRPPRPEPVIPQSFDLSDEEKAEQERQQAHREALIAASEARRAHLRRLLSQRFARGEVLQPLLPDFGSPASTLAGED